eukprot:XP_014036803.1 PREDICTED: uncharacterized protein LOC106590369 [Salmo salar]
MLSSPSLSRSSSLQLSLPPCRLCCHHHHSLDLPRSSSPYPPAGYVVITITLSIFLAPAPPTPLPVMLSPSLSRSSSLQLSLPPCRLCCHHLSLDLPRSSSPYPPAGYVVITITLSIFLAPALPTPLPVMLSSPSLSRSSSLQLSLPPCRLCCHHHHSLDLPRSSSPYPPAGYVVITITLSIFLAPALPTPLPVMLSSPSLSRSSSLQLSLPPCRLCCHHHSLYSWFYLSNFQNEYCPYLCCGNKSLFPCPNYSLHLNSYFCHLADSYPERLTGAIRVKCLAQGHIVIVSLAGSSEPLQRLSLVSPYPTELVLVYSLCLPYEQCL